MTGSFWKKYIKNAHNESSLSITSNDINVELSKEFLVELRKNTYHETLNEDVVDHIAKGKGKITTWEELVEKFVCRFYPESYDGEDEMLDEGENWGIDLLEFLSNMNTSFKNHKKVDERTKKVLFHSWMNGNWNKRYVNNSILNDDGWKESKYENPPNIATDLFFKAYDIRDIEEEIRQGQMKHKNNDSDNKQPSKKKKDYVKMEILLEPTSNKLLVGSNTLSLKPCQGGSSKFNLPDHRYKRRKAQETKTKTSTNFDIQDLPLRYQVYRGRLLASFQEDTKYEHVSQDTRSQGGKDDQDKQGKDLEISKSKTKSKDNEKG
ncbi:hypothetical protein Tco_1378874 [Tanacetum coccineum]